MKTIYIAMGIATIALMGACSDQNIETDQEAISQQSNTTIQSAHQNFKTPQMASNGINEQISGTLMRSDNGFTLFTDRYLYKVVGTDLSSFVGKNIQITGTIEERVDMPIITISSIHLIE
jgi:hypothetical protein